MINIEVVTCEIINLKLKFTSEISIKNYIERYYNLKINDQIWTCNNKIINQLEDDKNYLVFKSDPFVNIKVLKDNNIISLPQISKKTKIKEINKMFNFNNLYYNNKKLKSNYTLDKYDITDNSILYVNI
jgi:hypothetical protein